MLVLKDPQSGSRAGTTASHNRYGQYERNRRSPTQAPTDRRTAIRTVFSAASTAWSGLDDATRASWTAWAASHPIVNALGSSVIMDGHAAYVRIYTNRLNAGLTVPTAPPTSDAVPFNPASVVLVLDASPTFTINTGVQTGVAKILLAAGPPRPGGRYFEGTFSQLDSLTPSATVQNKLDLLEARWGDPILGKAQFVKLTPINPEGVAGAPLVIRTLVEAGP